MENRTVMDRLARLVLTVADLARPVDVHVRGPGACEETFGRPLAEMGAHHA